MFERHLQLGIAVLCSAALAGPPMAGACTSLVYRDAKGGVYYGRSLELTMELPYVLAYVPVGVTFRSVPPDQQPLIYTSRYRILAVTVPDREPTVDNPLGPSDLKAIEGMNDAGLTFSLLSYPAAGGGDTAVKHTRAALSASDLGSWVLGQFATVAEVKAALAKQEVVLVKIPMLDDAESPFHYVVHDKTGASIVIEWNKGKKTVYDNPVGVMTNGPQFSWHLTNLSNWTQLTNVDRSSNKFGSLTVTQPDSGIATQALPGSNTSVGRFIRAVYYSQFAEKVDDPDRAVRTLAHVMNNFDRPRGITIDPGEGGGLEVAGLEQRELGPSTEYTSWTNLSDLVRGRFYVRSYAALNYTMFAFDQLTAADGLRAIPMARLGEYGGDGNAVLLAAKVE